MTSFTLELSPSLAPFPYAALGLAPYLSEAEHPSRPFTYTKLDVTLSWSPDAKEATLRDAQGTEVKGQDEIVRVLSRAGGVGGEGEEKGKIEEFHTIASGFAGQSFPQVTAQLDAIDEHLAVRAFLVDYRLTSADFAVWGAIKAAPTALGILKKNAHPHVQRWTAYLESLPSTAASLAALIAARSNKAASKKAASSFQLGLPNAVDGKVVTRFPPEPSGYLHIGHAKAALLNEYFAHHYHGHFLVRFDDTNPSKEKAEFQQSIIEDLALLGLAPDATSHTSDHFDKLYEFALQIIKSGNAYADDTVQEQMRAERMDGIASKRRDATVEENLARFEEMSKGTEEGQRWCIRAKISVDNPNKALRDPVIYRCNPLPHHRTGEKWKVYPTYDFACPIVDSLEGVTHALRTNEYRDRNPQYYWMIDALGLRKPDIWDFSRMNFQYTLLSKRKLSALVDTGAVKGWDDPRFPTVRGIRRRGMTIEALREYILLQGPSQSVVNLQWDSIWSLNKQKIDPVVPRFTALATENLVKVTVRGAPSPAEVKDMPKHNKNPDLGKKRTVFGADILIEQEDAKSLEDKEEITLMAWGNAIVRNKTVSPEGVITAIEMDLHLEGDFKLTKKKITWLAAPSESNQLPDVTLLDYDYLITKPKLEEDDKVDDYLTKVTEFVVPAVADANVSKLSKGDIFQFERKGYYIVDAVHDGGKRVEAVRIPDGKAANIASKDTSGAADRKPAKGKQPKKDKEAKVGKGKAPADGAKGSSAPGLTDKAPAESKNSVHLSEGTKGFEIPVSTKMFVAPKVYGSEAVETPVQTKMHQVDPVYKA